MGLLRVFRRMPPPPPLFFFLFSHYVFKMCGEFSNGDVLSVQFMPSKSVRVTFKDEAIRLAVLNSQCLSVDNVQCAIRGGGPRPENVLVFRYPFEADLSALKEVMSRYGVVHEVKQIFWLHLDNVADGLCVVRMTRSKAVPHTLQANDHLIKAWYRGMPITCDICERPHKAHDCPHQGLCMHCCQLGHVQRDCTNAPNAWGTASAVPPPAEADAVPAIVPDAASPPVPLSPPSPVPVVAYSDSSEVVTEVIDAGGVSVPMGLSPSPFCPVTSSILSCP